MSLTTPQYLIRIAIMLGVAVFCLSVSFRVAFSVVLVMGHAHYLMAYLYQYKAGKMDRGYLARLFAMFALMLVALEWLDWGAAIYLLGSGYFVLHFLYDERFLLADGNDFRGWLRVLPIVLIYVAAPIHVGLGLDLQPLAGMVAVGGFALHAGAMAIARRRPSQQDISFLLIFAIGMTFLYPQHFGNLARAGNGINFIVITHYMNWYFQYLVRFRDAPKSRNTLLVDIAWTNGLILAVYLAARNLGGPFAAVGSVMFTAEWYFGWTLLHYFVTFRPSDLRNWVPTAAPFGPAAGRA